MPADDNHAVKLQYIDKIQTALFEVGRRGHRIFLLYTTLSILIILFVGGAITVDRQISIGGFAISAPTSTLLLVSALILAGLQFYDTALSTYQLRLRDDIKSIYQSLELQITEDPLESD